MDISKNTKEWQDVVFSQGATLKVGVWNNDILSVERMDYNSGYAVSIKRYELTTYTISPELVTAYIRLHAKDLQDNPNYHVGLWCNKDETDGVRGVCKWYLDISVVYDSIYNAIDTAHMEKQLAIYDFKRQESIDVYTLQPKR